MTCRSMARADRYPESIWTILRRCSIFTELCRSTNARGNLVADAYLAALAIEHGVVWMTADRHFARIKGLRWRHPLDR